VKPYWPELLVEPIRMRVLYLSILTSTPESALPPDEAVTTFSSHPALNSPEMDFFEGCDSVEGGDGLVKVKEYVAE